MIHRMLKRCTSCNHWYWQMVSSYTSGAEVLEESEDNHYCLSCVYEMQFRLGKTLSANRHKPKREKIGNDKLEQ